MGTRANDLLVKQRPPTLHLCLNFYYFKKEGLQKPTFFFLIKHHASMSDELFISENFIL